MDKIDKKPTHISVTFDNDIDKILRTNAQNKSLTISAYVRDLVTLGLQVEQKIAQQASVKIDNKAENASFTPTPTSTPTHNKSDVTQPTTQKNNLAVNYEILYLVRYLAAYIPEDKLAAQEMMNKAYNKAQEMARDLN